MKRFSILCMSALLLIGTASAQLPVAGWQAEVNQLKGKDRKNPERIVAIARTYFDAGQIAEAQACLEQARKLDSKSSSVYLLEGDIALAQHDAGLACQCYEQAIYFDRQCKDAYLKYARVFRTSNPAVAEEKLKQLQEVFPDCPEADRELAGLYYASNRFDKAAVQYARFIDTPVATEEDLAQYAFVLFLNRDFRNSLEQVRKGLQRNPHGLPFNRLAMYDCIELKHYDEAGQAAEALFQASDTTGYVALDYRYYGTLLSAREQYARAVEAYTRALELDSTQTALWLDIADAYEQMDDYACAISACRTYCSSLAAGHQSSAEVLFRLGRLYYGQGVSSDTLAVDSASHRSALLTADSLFAKVSDLVPGSYMGELWRARTQSALDPETTQGLAKPYYEKVTSVLSEKDDPKYNSVLVECYRYLGYYYLLKADYPTSREYWNKILALEPENAVAQKALEGIRNR